MLTPKPPHQERHVGLKASAPKLSRQQRRRVGLKAARNDLGLLKKQHAAFRKAGVKTIPRPYDWRDIIEHHKEQQEKP